MEAVKIDEAQNQDKNLLDLPFHAYRWMLIKKTCNRQLQKTLK